MREREAKDYSLGVYAVVFQWNPPPWFRQGACRNDKYRPSWWTRSGKRNLDKELRARATAICQYECPVRWKCLARFLNEEHGIWGGLDEAERESLKKSLNSASWSNPDILRAKLEKRLVTESGGSSVEIRVSNL